MQNQKSVSIVMPAYKEEDFIQQTLLNFINEFRKNHIDFEIIVIIDRVPNDNTYTKALEISKKNNEIRIIVRDGKHGIGRAVTKGIECATKDCIIITTAEVSEEPEDLVKMCLKMNDGYDMVFGNRFYPGAKRSGYNTKKHIGNRLCNYTIKILFGIKSNDITNGIKVYKSEILKNVKLHCTEFDIFAEIPIKVYSGGYRNFIEIPITHKARGDVYSKFDLSKLSRMYFKIVMQCYFQKLFNSKKMRN